MIRAGIIGYGRMGSGTNRDYKLLPKIYFPYSVKEAIQLSTNMVLRAACDTNGKLVENLPEDVEHFTSYEAMLTSVPLDFVAITTRTSVRCEITDFALKRGIKLLHLEKPLCNSIIQLQDLRRKILRNNAKFTYGALRRYLMPYKIAKKLSMHADFGDITRIVVSYGPTNLFWSHPHSIDLFLYYLGDFNDVQILEVIGETPKTKIVGNSLMVVDDPVISSAKLIFNTKVLAEINSNLGNCLRIISNNNEIVIFEDGKRVVLKNSKGLETLVWSEALDEAIAGFYEVLKTFDKGLIEDEVAGLEKSMEDAFIGQQLLFEICSELIQDKVRKRFSMNQTIFLGKSSSGQYA